MIFFCALINILYYMRQLKNWRNTLSVLFCHSFSAHQAPFVKWESKLASEGLRAFSDLSDAKLDVATLLWSDAHPHSYTWGNTHLGEGRRVSGVNVKHFSIFHSFLQELWSGGWLCASSSDKANERKSKQRGGEGIQQGVCLQPERAASTGLGDEIRFSIRETCL